MFSRMFECRWEGCLKPCALPGIFCAEHAAEPWPNDLIRHVGPECAAYGFGEKCPACASGHHANCLDSGRCLCALEGHGRRPEYSEFMGDYDDDDEHYVDEKD